MENENKLPSFSDGTWEKIKEIWRFTVRQLEIVRLLCEEDLSAKSIAEKLGIAIGTVRSHCREIRMKMRLRHNQSITLRIVAQAVRIEYDVKQEQG